MINCCMEGKRIPCHSIIFKNFMVVFVYAVAQIMLHSGSFVEATNEQSKISSLEVFRFPITNEYKIQEIEVNSGSTSIKFI